MARLFYDNESAAGAKRSSGFVLAVIAGSVIAVGSARSRPCGNSVGRPTGVISRVRKGVRIIASVSGNTANDARKKA